jgi:hypothetical protein
MPTIVEERYETLNRDVDHLGPFARDAQQWAPTLVEENQLLCACCEFAARLFYSPDRL